MPWSIRASGSMPGPDNPMVDITETPVELEAAPSGRLAAVLDHDMVHSFLRSKVTIAAAVVFVLIVLAAMLAPWIAPHDPFDLKQLSLLDSHNPPVWAAGGDWRFLLGTDDQGRDVLSAILYGARISITVGVVAMLLSATIGITLGLIAGYVGGVWDAVIMRIADVQLTFPAILIALLIDGTVRALFGEQRSDESVFWVMVVSIGLSIWVQYARTVRGSTLVEKTKDYIEAARLIGIHPALILFRHVLPNVMGPVLVIATINVAVAILTEATLSFLGVGLPPTEPSLGTLVRIGNNFLFSGEWWIAIFPGLTLAALVLSVNLVGDWLRDALNPKLR
jgi:peptide/nickel transport system permease protein